MVSIFEYNGYREFIVDWIKEQPRGGRGIKGVLAQKLGVSSTLISFVINGKKYLTLEQASDLADYFNLSELECELLFLMVDFERAGTERLKTKLRKRLKSLQAQGKKVTTRVTQDMVLATEKEAIYYSSWIYTGIRNLVAAEDFKGPGEIAERLNVAPQIVSRALQFLFEQGLCIEKKGLIRAGPTYTHIGTDSPFVDKHRQNWRLRGFSFMEQRKEDDLFYTSPMSLSVKDVQKVRARLLTMIEEVVGIMRPSPSEKVACLNIDWFEY